MTAADITLQQDKFQVTGAVTMENVMALRDKGIKAFARLSDIVIDFSQMQSCDSSGLALLVDWIQFANKGGRHIRFQYLPQDVFSLAKAAGLEEILLTQSA